LIRSKLVFEVDYENKRILPIRLETAADRKAQWEYENNPFADFLNLEFRSDYRTLRSFIEGHSIMYGDTAGLSEEEVLAFLDAPLDNKL